MEAKPATCLNCHAALHGAFCHECGQKHAAGRLSTKALFSQLIEALTDSDGTIWQTLRKLARNPGKVAIDYIEGGRAQFLNPVRFLIAAFTIYFGLMVMTGAQIDIANRVNIVQANGQLSADAQTFLTYLKGVIGSQMDIVIFFAIPLIAFLMRWQYCRAQRNYAETFTFICFVFGLGYLYASVLVPIQVLFDLNSTIPKNIITSVLFTYGARTFFNMNWFTTLISSAATGLAYFAAITGVSVGITLAEIYIDRWL